MTMLHANDATSTTANETFDKLEPTNNSSFPQTPETKSIATAESENTAKTAYTTDTESSSALQNAKTYNKSFDEDDEEEEEKTTEVDAHFYPHYEIVSRWSDLTQKRLDLCRQRVDLEQRLFEFAELRQHRDRSEKTWHSFRDPREEETQDPSAFFTEESSLRQPDPVSPTTEKPSAYPTLCSVRWETVHFPDGQIYEGQVLVLLTETESSRAGGGREEIEARIVRWWWRKREKEQTGACGFFERRRVCDSCKQFSHLSFTTDSQNCDDDRVDPPRAWLQSLAGWTSVSRRLALEQSARPRHARVARWPNGHRLVAIGTFTRSDLLFVAG